MSSNLDKSVSLYKSIVDEFAQIHEGVHRTWVMERGWPQKKENEDINQLLAKLNHSEKETLVKLLDDARVEGIHDTLVMLNDRMDMDGLRFVENGVEMAWQPFDSTLYYDWMCRKEKDDWPDENESSK